MTNRLIFIFLISLFLGSCGNQKIRFRRIHSQPQTIITIDEERSAKTIIPKVETKVQTDLITVEPTISKPTAIDESKEIESEPSPKPPTLEDSVSLSQTVSQDEKVEQALTAERDAKLALGLLIGSFVGFFALLIPGIILFIFGAIYYFRAKNSRYISEEGSNKMRFARLFFIIDFVLSLALVIGITGIIINNML